MAEEYVGKEKVTPAFLHKMINLFEECIAGFTISFCNTGFSISFYHPPPPLLFIQLPPVNFILTSY